MTTKLSYTLHEPTPSNHKLRHTGIGGAGNITKSRPAPPTTLLPPPHAPSSSSTSSSGRHNHPSSSSSSSSLLRSVGRGGVGNMYRPKNEEDRGIFSFDEELEREARRAPPSPIYHVGRGGQANVVDERERERRTSGSSGGSEGEGLRKGSLEWVKGLARKV